MTNNPAAFIARRWYHDLDLIYAGVNFGEVMTYDLLQVINRSILRQQELESQQSDRDATATATDTTDATTASS
jgi:hypothetical protein